MAVIPISKRPVDLLLVTFYAVNVLFICYFIDIESLTVDDPRAKVYPAWPPKFVCDYAWWWAETFDHAMLERPIWWKVTIWWDVLLQGPYYALAVYAILKGKNWIRIPAIIYASVLTTIVSISLSETIWGDFSTPDIGVVVRANIPWVVIPIITLIRFWAGGEKPFDEKPHRD